MVYLHDYLDIRRIALMEADSKTKAIDRLIDLSGSDGHISDLESFRAEIKKRESIVTTGIGMGVAIPHVKTRFVKAFFITIGVFKKGVNWDSLDGKPVHIAFLIGGPEDHQTYLQILAKLMLIIRNRDKRKAIVACGTPEEILEHFAAL
jgi:PTS system nitrogen regulatory IIA component